MKNQILTFAVVATIIGSIATGCSSSEKASSADSVTTTTTDSTVITPTDTTRVTDTTRKTM